ncbi:MAG: ABC transporter permease [Holosporales bacterium]|jgi:ABC-2 type transport system permease protein|nr:ABC transporter permease [Holosporales bacterium]
MVSRRRVFSILKKEVFHILRDPFTIIMALVMPVVMVLIFGNAIEFNVQKVPTAYVDQDHSQSSRMLLRMLGSSQYFKLEPVDSVLQGNQRMERERASALIVIPPTFEMNLSGRCPSHVQVLLDGTDNSSVGAIAGYIGLIQEKIIKEIYKGGSIKAPLKVESRFLFNPELSSQWFIVPGLTAVIMAILSILLTALTISREWESGSMELLLSTPVRPIEIVCGKIIPYAFLGIFSVFVVYLIARIVYSLPFVGSHWVFGLGALLFLLSYLGLGLLVSTVVRNQQAAVQVAMVLGLMPSMLFSGFIFPLEQMHVVCRWIATIFPAQWFVDIARDQFLKGSSIANLWLPFSALLANVCLIVSLCVQKFKRTLEK